MHSPFLWHARLAAGLVLVSSLISYPFAELRAAAPDSGKFLYVAMPGVRNYLEYGGHGVLVFDMEQQFKFVKRIPSAGLAANGKPSNVKGVCASAATGRLYISTL